MKIKINNNNNNNKKKKQKKQKQNNSKRNSKIPKGIMDYINNNNQ